MTSRPSFHGGPSIRIGMADAARGAATKSGGWRSSGRLSCQSKPLVDEPVSGCRDHAPKVRAICASYARALSCVFTLQITRDRTALSIHIYESTRAASAITSSASSCARCRQGSSLRSDPLCGPAGLDDTCAHLEGSTYVMAEEARRIVPY